MVVVQVKGAAAAGAAGFLVPVGVRALQEQAAAPQPPHQAIHIVAGKDAAAPAVDNFRVFRLQTLAQGPGDLPNQETKGHMADPLPMFQGVGHYHHIHHPAAVAPIAGAGRQIQRRQGFGQGLLQFRSQRRRLKVRGRGGRRPRGISISIIGRAALGFLSGRRRIPLRPGDYFLIGGHRLHRAVVAAFLLRRRFIGHQHPIHQAVGHQLNVAGVGGVEHQFLEPGKAEFLFVEAGDAAHNPLFQGSQQGHPAGLPLGADNVLNNPDDFGQLLLAGDAAAGRRAAGRGRRRGHRFRRRLRIHIAVVENQPVHLVGQPAGGTPGNADDDDPLANGPQGIDDMDEVGVAGNQHIGADVGVSVGALDAVGGHLDIHAVFHPKGAGVAGQAADRQAGGNIDRLDAGGVESRRIVDELAGSAQFRRAGDPVGVSLGDHDPAVMGNLLFEGGNIGRAAAAGQADLKVFPVDEQGDVVAILGGAICGYNKLQLLGRPIGPAAVA